MNLLGLLLGRLVERSLRDPQKARILSSMNGRILFQAGRMKVFLVISEKGIFIESPNLYPSLPGGEGQGEGLTAIIKGSIPAFMALGSGSLNPLPFLTGKVRVRGNPFVLLRLGKIFRPSFQ